MSRRKNGQTEQPAETPEAETHQQPVQVQLTLTYQGQPLMVVSGSTAITLPAPDGQVPLVGVVIAADQLVPALLAAIQQRVQQQSSGIVVPGRTAPLFDPKARADAKALLKRND